MANVDEPRDPVEAWEFHVECQFRGLLRWARRKGCLLRLRDLPERDFGPGGQEHIIYHDVVHGRFWKVTFPNTSGIGPSGFFTPAGYLNRLRLSNRIFGDDVRFEGILSRKAGISIVTSQHYVLPHPERFIPTESEIARCMRGFGFKPASATTWIRDDGVSVGDVHNRNLIRRPDGVVEVIDVQPILSESYDWDGVREAGH